MKKLPGDIILHKCTKNYDPGFKISCLQFAICEAFWQFAKSFCIFSKISQSLRSDTVLHEFSVLFIELAI